MVRLVSSPMNRTLETAAPTAVAAGKRLLVHGGIYEYGAIGSAYSGTSPSTIESTLKQKHPALDLDFTLFPESGGWAYPPPSDIKKESVDQAKARVQTAAQWIESELLPLLNAADVKGVGVVFAHQTFLDLLVQWLAEGSQEHFVYGCPRFKLQNAAFVEVVVRIKVPGRHPTACCPVPLAASHQ